MARENLKPLGSWLLTIAFEIGAGLMVLREAWLLVAVMAGAGIAIQAYAHFSGWKSRPKLATAAPVVKRHLSDEEKSTLQKRIEETVLPLFLADNNGMQISRTEDDAEAEEYAKDFKDVFQRAGVVCGPLFNQLPAPGETGLALGVAGADNPPETAIEIMAALTLIGLKAHYGKWPVNFLPYKRTVVLFVAPRPL